MAGDISRESFQQSRHYSAVRAQQGRVQLDADTNEQVWIEHHRIETETIDVIGLCGVPEDKDGFRIGLLPDGTDLTISPGRIYVDGLLGELDATAVPITFPTGSSNVVQLDSLVVDNRQMSVGDWVEVSATNVAPQPFQVTLTGANTPTLTLNGSVAAFQGQASPVLQRIITYTTQADLPNPEFASTVTSPPTSPPQPQLSLSDGLYIVYVDLWKREITALDDPHLREVALGGPDTCTRLKNIAQVKLLSVATSSPGTGLCAADFPEWDALVQPPTGTLNARVKPADTTTNLCQLPPTAGFLRVENQTYHVQIHQGQSDRSSSTIKWSRESASVATRIQNIAGSVITVSDVGKDEVLGFNDDDWVEIVDDNSELNSFSRPLLQIDTVKPATREITVKQSIPAFTNAANLQLRRWDQSGSSATPNGVVITTDFQDLESGVQVLFSEGSYRTGDFWIIPARTSTGELDWPPFRVPNTNPIAQPPLGIAHHFCRLAILTVSGGELRLGVDSDCRPTFPPLTRVCKCDTGIQVLQIQSIDPKSQAHTLLNDSNLQIPSFRGIDATCDTSIAPISITRPTCFVTVEQPIFLPTTPVSQIAAAYSRVVLAGTVSSAGTVISWRATQTAFQFVNSLSIPQGDRGILARFTLKGNFIWSATDPNFFLDGDLFGVRQEGTTNISVRLPSGDHRRGGDLEMWFWLVPPPVPKPLTFNFSVQVARILRADGITELLDDLLLVGTGGEPTPPAQLVPLVNVTMFMNTNITSPLLGNQANPQQDAVLLIDDPTVLNIDPTTPTGNGIGLDFKGGGAPNTFIGQQTNMNSVTFFGVPLDPPGDNAMRIFRIKNLRVNANLLGLGGLGGPSQVVAFVSMSGSISAQLNNPQQTVAFTEPASLFDVTPSTFVVNTNAGVNTALATNPDDTTSNISFRLRFTEGFSGSFKIKTDNQSSVVTPEPQTDEEGFDNSGTGSLNVLPAGSKLPSIGIATNATQFTATFINVPIGVQIYVTVRDAPSNLPLTNPNSPPPIARLLNFTTGGAISEGIPITPITLAGATATAVWECVGRDPKLATGVETIDFGVVVAMLPNPRIGTPGPVSVALDLDPTSTIGVANASAPVPRFAASGQPPLQAITFFQSVPIANAGPEQTVAHNTTVQLSGSGQDPQNQTLTHRWTFLSIPAGSTTTLSNPGIANPTFTADKPGTYIVQLTVNNGNLDSKPSPVTITATNTPPVANVETPKM
jgi:hypothetical protein